MRLPTLLLLASCSDPPPMFEETTAIGIYDIDTWTANGVGCDVEGPSRYDSQPGMARLLYIRNENRTDGASNVNGHSVSVNPCLSVDDCLTHANNPMTNFGSRWFFFVGNDVDGYRHAEKHLYDPGPVCFDCHCTADRSTVSLTIAGGRILVTAQRFQFVTRQVSGPGLCPRDVAEDLLARVDDQPCAAREDLTATFRSTF